MCPSQSSSPLVYQSNNTVFKFEWIYLIFILIMFEVAIYYITPLSAYILALYLTIYEIITFGCLLLGKEFKFIILSHHTAIITLIPIYQGYMMVLAQYLNRPEDQDFIQMSNVTLLEFTLGFVLSLKFIGVQFTFRYAIIVLFVFQSLKSFTLELITLKINSNYLQMFFLESFLALTIYYSITIRYLYIILYFHKHKDNEEAIRINMQFKQYLQLIGDVPMEQQDYYGYDYD